MISPRDRRGLARPHLGTAARRTLLVGIALAGLFASGGGRAQPRAELVLGIAGAPVADAWNPVRAVVRDAPRARLRVEIDVGGLDRGEVLQRAEWTFPDASGVQRLDVDLPLSGWRRLSWRIEHGDRLLASGSLGARERDERPLALVVSAAAPGWYDAFSADVRPVPAASSDLPTRASSWDGVAFLLFDGTAAAPEAATVLAAAAAGVRVLLPTDAPAGYAALAPLLGGGEQATGAGSVAPLVDPRPDGRFGSADGDGAATGTGTRRAIVAAAARALPATRWDHLPRSLVAVLAGGYALLVWSLFRVGGPAGLTAGALVVAAAALVLPAAAPVDPSPVAEGAVVLAADGLGVRTELREVARLPRGEAILDGLFVPTDPVPVTWSDGTSRLPLAPGGRARLTGAPRIVYVPDDVREAPGGAASDLPEPLASAVPDGARTVVGADAWWLLRGAPDVTDPAPSPPAAAVAPLEAP